jgi:hypothetical protein
LLAEVNGQAPKRVKCLEWLPEGTRASYLELAHAVMKASAYGLFNENVYLRKQSAVIIENMVKLWRALKCDEKSANCALNEEVKLKEFPGGDGNLGGDRSKGEFFLERLFIKALVVELIGACRREFIWNSFIFGSGSYTDAEKKAGLTRAMLARSEKEDHLYLADLAERGKYHLCAARHFYEVLRSIVGNRSASQVANAMNGYCQLEGEIRERLKTWIATRKENESEPPFLWQAKNILSMIGQYESTPRNTQEHAADLRDAILGR